MEAWGSRAIRCSWWKPSLNCALQGRWPFYISVAVSPFKYTEADCAYQYLKLEKKIAAGADFAITQLGFDSRKIRELKRYLDERGLKTPVFGNVYVLPPKAAERMSKGEPPGCWVSPELLAKIQEEAKAEDKGLAARLERAAKMAAIVRGLGYAGAYIGGTHNPEHIRWIIRRSEELAPRWEELAEEISYGAKGGFYFFEAAKHPPKPKPMFARVADTMARLFPVKHENNALRRFLAAIMRWIDRRPAHGGGAGKSGAGHQEAALRMPGVRQLRFGRDGIRLPDDVPQEYAQRSLRRNVQWAMRSGSGDGLHLGEGL